MWRRFITDAVKTKRHHHHYINLTPIAAAISTDTSTFCRLYSVKPLISTLAKAKKKFKGDGKNDNTPGDSSVELDADVEGDKLRLKLLAEDEHDKSLDVGPNGLPLFTSVSSLSQLSRKDTCSYMKFRIEDLNAVLPEGLPGGMLKECIVDPPTWSSSAK
ncbi:Uncharacterized protein RDABS01_024433, partial [Bienertia sinuspersici]